MNRLPKFAEIRFIPGSIFRSIMCVPKPMIRILLVIALLASAAFSRTIVADLNNVKGPTDRFYNMTIGAGRAAELLRADVQRDMKIVRDECGFRYVRFHGLLHDELGVYQEDKNGKPVYNFQYVDQVYDAILKTGMKPFVEIGFMPDALKANDKTIFWWRGNIAPPKDYAKWEAFITALTRHWTDRYGEAEVKTWYFEVWNEPNLEYFFSGTQDDYFKLLASTTKAIKSVSPDYKTGGPATAGRGWVPETIAFAAKNNVPLDFITTHDYGVEGRGFDADGKSKLYLDTSADAIIRGVREVRGQIAASSMPKLPLHYTEWSASYSQTDPVHDSYVSAPYIVSRLKGSQGFADSMSYWTFTDNFEEGGPVKTPFHGGFGLINFQGLRKPSFYAYQFLGRLGDTELKTADADSFVTKSPTGAQVLLWNYTPPITTESNQVFYKTDIPSKSLGAAEILLSNVPNGEYELKIYQVGHDVNDVYGEYMKIGSPKNLSREQVAQLASRVDGRPRVAERVKIKGGKFTRKLELRENDVFLVTLEKVKK